MGVCDCLNGNYISILLAIIGIIYIYMKWKFTYWEKHNIPSFKPRLLFGNLENPFTRKISAGVEYQKFYEKFKSLGAKHGGIYSFLSPIYVPVDVETVKNILSADFQYFVNRGRYVNEKDDPITAHMFNLDGAKWKNLRVKFTPTFTSGKMKMMFQVILECGEFLKTAIDSSCSAKETIEIKSFTDKFTIDVIGNCVFGIQCNSFDSSETPFQKCGNLIFDHSIWEAAVIAFTFSFPDLSRKLRIRRFSKEATDFFMDMVRGTVNYRETNNIRRNDFMQMLIDLKNGYSTEQDKKEPQNEGDNLTMEQVTAQAVLFFVAGFDTSSTSISFVLFELASNHEMQEKVRKEIRQVLKEHDDQLTYESLSEMKYLQQVLNESLRKYPPLPILNRQCLQDYKFPGTDIILKKGTQIIVPLMGLHRDPELFPDPDKFDPERFSPSNKNKIVPFSFLPFGEGPRNCIGRRFGEMQARTGLALLLKDYQFSVNSKTIVPLEMDLSMMSKAKGGIWLDITKIK